MKKLIFLISLLAMVLTGCSKDDPVQPRTEKESSLTSIGGKIHAWNKGANCTLNFYTNNERCNDLIFISSAKIGTDGSFLLPLPEDIPKDVCFLTAYQLYMSVGGEVIQHSLSCSDSTAMIYNWSYFTVTDSIGKELGIVYRRNNLDSLYMGNIKPGDFRTYYVYAGSDVSVKGFIKYNSVVFYPYADSPQVTNNYNITLRKGWNSLSECLTVLKEEAGKDIVEFSCTSSEPGGGEWYFISREWLN